MGWIELNAADGHVLQAWEAQPHRKAGWPSRRRCSIASAAGTSCPTATRAWRKAAR
jgi:hypothetical protein